MQNETRFDRGAWVTVGVVVAWVVLLVGSTLAALSYPSDGWAHVRRGIDGAYSVNSPISNMATLLQAGDLIVAINGIPLTATTIPPLPAGLDEGQTLTYTIQRGESTFEITVPIVRTTPSGYLYNMLWRFQNTPLDHLLAIACFLVVAFAFYLRPGNLGARYLFLIFGFFLAITIFGFGIPSLFEFTYPVFLTFLLQLPPSSWFWYFFPSLTLMALAFPVIKAPLRRFPRLLPALLYGIPGFAALLNSFLLVTTRSYDSGDFFIPIAYLMLGLAVVSLFGSLIHNWLTVREPAARAQLRWVSLGLGLGLGLPFAIMLTVLLLKGNIGNELWFFSWLLFLLPVSLAIAITRYRLFDIDIIIRKTLQYSLLTGLLALVYFGTVVLLQNLFFGNQQSEIVIVLSTLAIAALFSPLRRRVQDFIDRRFYRKKYDAAQVLAQFAQTARDEVELDALTAELVRVIQETLQPEQVTLWLKPTTKPEP